MKRLGLLVLAIVAIIFLGRAILFNSETLQDRLVSRAVTAAFAAAAEPFGEDRLDVYFCGTASPMGAGQAQQCIAVLAGDHFFIVDSGARSTQNVTNAGLPVGRLDGVLLTHFHSDHISSLGEIHLASWVRGRGQKLPIYGGPGVDHVVDGFNMAYGQDYIYRTDHHGENYVPSITAGLKAVEIAAPETGMKVIFEEGDLKISAFTVLHEPIRPAYGYRFDYRGRSVVISGDTSKSANLVAAARDADVLIHEVLQPHLVKLTATGLQNAQQERLGKILIDTLDYHTTPVEAAEVANEANAELLIFTHYAPVPRNALMREIFLRGIDEVRAEGVLMAVDGTHIILPVSQNHTGDEIIVK